MRIHLLKPMMISLIFSAMISAGLLSSGWLSSARADEDVSFVSAGNPVAPSADLPAAPAMNDSSIMAHPPQIGGDAQSPGRTHVRHVHRQDVAAYYPYDSSYYYPIGYMPTYEAPPPPPPTYIDEDSGGYCRQFSQQKHVGNQVQESYGTACLQDDGTWHIERAQ